ncbi:MAG: glycosyltransferase family 1 protein [Microthrixaceae bacterium]
MRALLDATGLGSGAGGDETMLTGVLGGLAIAAEPTDRFTVVAVHGVELPATVRSDERFEVLRVRRRPGVLHYGVALPRLVRRTRPAPEVVFSVTHGPSWCRVPVALMVQDLSFEHRPDDYPLSSRIRLKAAVRAQVRTASGVLTVSEHARQDLIGTYHLDPSRVHHVPNAALPAPACTPDEMDRARRSSRCGVPAPYFLYLGNLHPRKNVARAIEAFGRAVAEGRASGHRMVIAGARWWGGGEKEAAERFAPEGSVQFLGRVDEIEREVLLRDAVAMVYLSLFEGFGLPPLEAMARGVPVIASEVTSIPEVVGDAGLWSIHSTWVPQPTRSDGWRRTPTCGRRWWRTGGNGSPTTASRRPVVRAVRRSRRSPR